MSEISGWLISVIGVVLMGVFADLIMPSGKLNGFIRSVFGFFTIVVIISPFPKLFNSNINLDEIFYNNTSTQIDDDYIDATTKKIIKNLEETTEKALVNAGFSNVNVEIRYIIENYSYSIKKVVLNLKKLVINSSLVHINKYTEMKQVVMDNLNVSKEIIEFNEWQKTNGQPIKNTGKATVH